MKKSLVLISGLVASLAFANKPMTTYQLTIDNNTHYRFQCEPSLLPSSGNWSEIVVINRGSNSFKGSGYNAINNSVTCYDVTTGIKIGLNLYFANGDVNSDPCEIAVAAKHALVCRPISRKRSNNDHVDHYQIYEENLALH